MPEEAGKNPRENFPHRDGGEAARSGLTWRALWVGLGLVVLISFGAPYSLWIVGASEITWSYFPIGIGVCFIVLLFANALVKRFVQPWALVREELIFILVMGLVASGMPTFMVGYILAIISKPYFDATSENAWSIYVQPYLPNWAIPSPEGNAMEYFYQGLPLNQERIPFEAWIGPLCWWLILVLVIYFVCFCLVVLLRRQWVEHERLSYPLVQVPLLLLEEKTGTALAPILRDRTFWIGVWVPLGIILYNIINYFEPGIPKIQLQQGVAVELVEGVFPLTLILYFPIVGFVYLVNTAISFSVLFFYVFTILEASLVSWGGYNLTRVDPFAWGWQLGLAWQAYGAFMAMVGWSVWMARQHLWAVIRQVFSGAETIEDAREMLSYRVALYGVLGGTLFVLGWLWASGMELPIAALCFFAALAIFLGITRLVIQTGLHHVTTPMSAQGLTLAITGTAVAPHNLVALGLSYSWCGDVQSIFMTTAAHAARLNERSGRPRHITVAIFAAAALGFVGSGYFMLELCYEYGAGNLRSWGFRPGSGAAGMAFGQIASQLQDPWPRDWAKLGYFGLGALLYSSIFICYQRFFWWPLHPVGLTVATLWMTRHIVVSVFIAWLCKRLILHFGGVVLYRRLLPFFIGLPVGFFIGVGISYLVDAIWFFGKGHSILHG